MVSLRIEPHYQTCYECQDLISHRLLRGANGSSASNKNPENEARDLIIMAVLIEHPHMGLILFETGCAEDVEIVSTSIL
jgi:hypothetical protein